MLRTVASRLAGSAALIGARSSLLLPSTLLLPEAAGTISKARWHGAVAAVRSGMIFPPPAWYQRHQCSRYAVAMHDNIDAQLPIPLQAAEKLAPQFAPELNRADCESTVPKPEERAHGDYW